MTYRAVTALSAVGYKRPNGYSVAAYWSDGWELRHLNWLRFHGFWPEAGRMQS